MISVATRLEKLSLDPSEPAGLLPEDVVSAILMFCTPSDLARAKCACRSWSSLVAMVCHRHCPGSTLRQLAAEERLRSRIGTRPARLWSSEWGDLLAEDFRLRGFPGPTPHEIALGEHSIEVMLRALSLPISWLKEAGWTAAHAEPATLLGFCGRAALGRALCERRSAYASCMHLLHDVFTARARALDMIAPQAYRNLSGNGGLVTDDPAWNVLCDLDLDSLERDVDGYLVGDSSMKIVTSALVLADTSPLNFASDAGYSVLTWAPDATGGGATMEYVLQESDVVCFRSEATDGRGYHSLLHTGGSGFTMPPMASVVIERVQRSGEWVANGHAIRRNLFTARFTYL